MGFYSDYILPGLLDKAMRQPDVLKLRRKLVPQARGNVLEIGIGSGVNLPLYSRDVTAVHGIEPSKGLRHKAEEEARGCDVPLNLVDAIAEDLPFDNQSFDTVISTWTMCTIPGLEQAFEEIRRVIKPDGQLLFVEHGKSPDTGVHRWQNRINPVWKCVGGGCHLNRAIDERVEAGGFAIDGLETGYLARGPRWATWMYMGKARLR